MKNVVSVILIVYNSVKTVLETLESIKNQTYQNIELIITDDKSTDNTCEVTREWLKCNKDRFLRVELIESDKNTGVTANLNRGVKSAHGKFIRPIAGDDILTNHSLEVVVALAVSKNSNWVVGRCEIFSDNGFLKECSIRQKQFDLSHDLIKNNFQVIKKNEAVNHMICSPSAYFFSKKLVDKLGGGDGFDEKYKMMEDYPFYLKLCQLGYVPEVTDEVVIKYRMNRKSITLTNDTVIKNAFLDSVVNFYFDVRKPLLFKNKFFVVWLKQNLLMLYYQSVLKNGESAIKTEFYIFIYWQLVKVLKKFKIQYKGKECEC